MTGHNQGPYPSNYSQQLCLSYSPGFLYLESFECNAFPNWPKPYSLANQNLCNISNLQNLVEKKAKERSLEWLLNADPGARVNNYLKC